MKEKRFKVKKGTHVDFVVGGDGFSIDFGDHLLENYFDEKGEYTSKDFEVIIKPIKQNE